MWLLLNRFSLGHLLLGTVVALVAGRAMAALEPGRPRIRRRDLVLRLFALVMVDIVRSNIAVARLILRDRAGPAAPGFVEIDLELSDPTALAVAGGDRHQHARAPPGSTTTPRAAGCCMHVLDLDDEDEWREIVNDRYGTPAEGDLRMSATILDRRDRRRPGRAGAGDGLRRRSG